MRRTPLKRKTRLQTKTPLKSHKIDSKRFIPTKRTNPAKKKKSDLQKLKTKLWKLCREIQIKQHGRICYTCGAKDLQGSNCHLGHFIPSSVCSTEMRYDLDNLRPQCYRCNIHLSGNWIEYEKHLLQDGIDIQELKDRNEKTKGEMYREDWYRAKIDEYEKILQGLC